MSVVIPGTFSLNRVATAKTGSERCFGVELETSKVAEGNCHRRMKDYFADCGTVFGAKYDDTCHGLEFYSPILKGDAGLDECRLICDTALENDAEVNRDCGYHAHFDLRGETGTALKRIAMAYHYTYPVWRNCVDTRRQQSNWCHPHRWDRRDVDHLPEDDSATDFAHWAERLQRYNWVNFYAYTYHKTVEIRLHGGTLDADEVCNWVIAHCRFIDAAKEMSTAKITRVFGRKSPKQLYREMRVIWQSSDIAEFYASRVRNHCGYVDKVLENPKDT